MNTVSQREASAKRAINQAKMARLALSG